MKKFTTLTLVLLFLSCGKNEEVKPLRQDIQELVFASGQLEWDDSYNVIAQTDGGLGKVVFEVGQTVAKGMIIASIDNKVNEVNAESAQEQLVISNQNVTANAPALLQLEQNIQFAQSKYLQDKSKPNDMSVCSKTI